MKIKRKDPKRRKITEILNMNHCEHILSNVDCFIDMTSGSVAKSPLGARKTITMKKVSNELFEAVLVPQNIENNTPLIELTMGGIAYLLDHAISFRAGYVHTILLTVNTSPDQEKIDISIDAGMGQMQ